MTVVFPSPGPGDGVPTGLVVGPAAGLEQPPRAGAGPGGCGPRSRAGIPPASCPSNGSMPDGARNTGGRTRGPGSLLSCRKVAPGGVAIATAAARSASPGKAAGDAGLVMVFQEVHQLGLVAQGSPRRWSRTARVLGNDPVIEPLVRAPGSRSPPAPAPIPCCPVGFGDDHRVRVPGTRLPPGRLARTAGQAQGPAQ